MVARRQVVLAIGAGVVTAPLVSFAQLRKLWRVGLLTSGRQSDLDDFKPFEERMKELGYVQGRDFVIDFEFTDSNLARLPSLATKLVALKVDLLVTIGTPSSIAASKATRELPIMFLIGGDPVSVGLVNSLARPGGNITGFTALSSELHSKRLDLMRQLLPNLRRVGVLYVASNPADQLFSAGIESDCRKLKLQHIPAPVNTVEMIPAAFGALAKQKAQALLVTESVRDLAESAESIVIEQAAINRLPVCYGSGGSTTKGGLIAYGSAFEDFLMRMAVYADKIFKGAKPGDLPIEQPTKFDLAVNMKTAKALGIKIPNSILVQATKVIE